MPRRLSSQGICSICGHPSGTNPGPICAERLLNGRITRYQIEQNISNIAFKNVLKKFEWHESPAKFNQWLLDFSNRTKYAILKSFRFSNFEAVFNFFNRRNEINLVRALALNDHAKDIRRHFLTHGDDAVRAFFISLNDLTEPELEEGLMDPSDTVFEASCKKTTLNDRIISNVVNESTISESRKITLLMSDKCSTELLCDIVRDPSKIRMTKSIILFRKRISNKLMRTILSNVDNRALLNILRKRPDSGPWIKSINYRIAEIDNIKKGK